jgi:hypothetical protein
LSEIRPVVWAKRSPAETLADTRWIFFRKENTVSRSIRVEPYNHHLEEFLSFFKKERGFADATIVNRTPSLTPYFGLAGRTRRAALHRVAGRDYQLSHRHQ